VLLNKKSHGICHNGHLQKIGKAGQNADISTEDALLNKKAMAFAEVVICRKLGKAGQMVPTLPQRTARC
jgi:hypothetical protein